VTPTPTWVDALTAVLAVVGAFTALIGSFGLLRMNTYFRRVHPPSLVATLATWSVILATVLQSSFVTARPYLHAVVIPVFIALSAPITTVLLTRAALFRARQRGATDVPPPPTSE
jgi:multicomponent K+:H+ antiporter subunit G